MDLNHPDSVSMDRKRAVGVFSNRQTAEQALQDLRDTGFSMEHVSVIARDAARNEEIAGTDVSRSVGNKADEGAAAGALSGVTLGGLTGLLVGLGLLAIPGIGPVMLAGATATTIATTLAGGAIGATAGSLLGALVGLGIPEKSARVYNERVSRGEFLVIVDGTDEEIRRAERILSGRGIEEWEVYNVADTKATPIAVAGRPSSTVATLPTTASVPNQTLKTPVNTTDAESIKLYEERLIVDKQRTKTGEVSLSKHIETETARVEVPIERERVVVERVTPVDAGVPVAPDQVAFGSEVVQVEVYEETADIHKEAFVREEVRIRKEAEQENVDVQETLRREELNLNVDGNPVVNAPPPPEKRI